MQRLANISSTFGEMTKMLSAFGKIDSPSFSVAPRIFFLHALGMHRLIRAVFSQENYRRIRKQVTFEKATKLALTGAERDCTRSVDDIFVWSAR